MKIRQEIIEGEGYEVVSYDDGFISQSFMRPIEEPIPATPPLTMLFGANDDVTVIPTVLENMKHMALETLVETLKGAPGFDEALNEKVSAAAESNDPHAFAFLDPVFQAYNPQKAILAKYITAINRLLALPAQVAQDALVFAMNFYNYGLMQSGINEAAKRAVSIKENLSGGSKHGAAELAQRGQLAGSNVIAAAKAILQDKPELKRDGKINSSRLAREIKSRGIQNAHKRPFGDRRIREILDLAIKEGHLK